MQFNTLLFASLIAGCLALMLAERLGAPVTLALDFKGDLKRESRWFAQYGQGACVVIAALLVWRLDTARPHAWVAVGAAPFVTSLAGLVVKRLFGRVRPGRENAGKFLGPAFKHANFRESFPSNHSAAAVAFSVVLATLYPPAAAIFWTLAIICAAIRYLMDAHFPSDVMGGIAFGYVMGFATMSFVARLGW